MYRKLTSTYRLLPDTQGFSLQLNFKKTDKPELPQKKVYLNWWIPLISNWWETSRCWAVDLDNFIYTVKAPILNIAGLIDVLQSQLPPEVLASLSSKRIIGTDFHLDKAIQAQHRSASDITKPQKITWRLLL